MNIVHLHTHSHYSLLDGLAKIPDLVAKAKIMGSPAVALTDHGIMYGAIEFYKACKEAGIKPIIGCELYIARRGMQDRDPKLDAKPYHLTVLAKDNIGYKNLIKLVSKSHLEGFYYKPRVDKKLLKQYSQGLIFLSGCLVSEFGKAAQMGNYDKTLSIAKEYMAMVGEENYYLEIQPHSMADQLKANSVAQKVAKTLGRPIVVTNDIHYLNKQDQDTHEVLLSINTGKDLDDSERLSLKDASIYMMTPEEILQAIPNNEIAIEATEKLSEKVKIEFEFGNNYLPIFPLPKGEKDSKEYLRKKTYEGLKKYYSSEKLNEAKERLEYELKVIEKTGFGDYFLIVSDIVNWAKDNGIAVGPGRGSAAGSLASYVLNITSLDPLKYNLIFERFLNPDRISMPDIDLDFADDRRGEVIDYIKNRYGDDHVAQIITFGVMKARLSVRDVTRAIGLPYSLGDQIAKLIPFNVDLKEALRSIPDLRNMYKDDPNAKKVIDLAERMEGVARHASTHAAGVVISKEPLVEYLPLQRSTTPSIHSGQVNEGVTTQYDMKMVEAIGLLKMDILGLANLTIMKNALRIIRKIDGAEINIEKIPLDDKKTFHLLSRAETVGVFQLESPGMQRYLKELKPTEMEDIISMVALYRPGPMESIPDFIEGKHARKKISYLNSALEPILKSTYGVIVTQDQVLQIARDIAGFTYGEADILRKAVGKKNKNLLDEQRDKFIIGAMETQKISRENAQKVWDFIEPFARYGFNRAHAACYAMIAYQTAYLKANYPHPFMAALLTSEHKDLDKVAVAIAECERMDIKVLLPDINESFVEFGVVESEARNPEPLDDARGKRVERVEASSGDPERANASRRVIRFGLGAIKNVGEKAAQMIVEERQKNGKFDSLDNFLTRIGGQIINKKVIESLTKSGGFNGLEEPNMIIAGIEDIIKFSQAAQKQKVATQADLFGEAIKIDVGKLKLPEVAPAAKKLRLSWEKEFLGIYISEHPLKEYANKMDPTILAIANLTNDMTQKNIRVAGIITNSKKIITKNNQPMAFIQFEDLTGNCEIVVFPSVLEKYSELLSSNTPIVVDGRVSLKDGSIKIITNAVYQLGDELPELTKNGIYINGNKWDNGEKKFIAEKKNVKNKKNTENKNSGVTINIPRGAKKDILLKIKKIIEKNPGKLPVILMIPHNGDYHQIATKSAVDGSDKCIIELKKIVGDKNVLIV